MSFILDALKKSEGERQRQNGPTMFEVRRAPRAIGLPTWAIVVAALLVVNLAVLAWVLTRAGADDRVVPASLASSTTDRGDGAGVTSPAASSSSATSMPPTVATRPVIPPPPPAWSADSNATAIDTTARANVDASAPNPRADRAPPGSDAALAAGRVNPADYEPAEPATTNDGTGSNAVSRAGGATPLPVGDVPTRDELAPALANQIPDIRIDLHAYSQSAQDRFVFINMRRYDEGDTTPEGLRIDAITPEGAVLEFRGTRFLLRRE